MAALTMGEIMLRRDLLRAVAEWELGLRHCNKSEDLRFIIQQIAEVAELARTAPQSLPAEMPAELARANERLARIISGRKGT